MREVATMIWTMTASHDERPMPPKEATAFAQAFDNGGQAAFRAALDRMARCSTGRLAYDQASGFYVPEQTENCR